MRLLFVDPFSFLVFFSKFLFSSDNAGSPSSISVWPSLKRSEAKRIEVRTDPKLTSFRMIIIDNLGNCVHGYIPDLLQRSCMVVSE